MAVDYRSSRGAGADSPFVGPRVFIAYAAKFLYRRLLVNFASGFANARFYFAVGGVSLLAAKLLHVFSHLRAIRWSNIGKWGCSFLAQDVVLLLVLRVLMDQDLFAKRRWARGLCRTLAAVVIAIVYFESTINLAFFAVTGTEVHWRNVAFASGGKSSMKVLLSGVFSCVVVGVANLLVSYIVQDLCYVVGGVALELIKKPFRFILSKLPFTRNYDWSGPSSKEEYTYIPLGGDGDELPTGSDKPKHESVIDSELSIPDLVMESRFRVYVRAVVALWLIATIVESAVRPNAGSYVFMSWTLPILPLVDVLQGSKNLDTLSPYHGNSINHDWDQKTAISKTREFSWLPKDTPLAGFDDWYKADSTHYDARQDPLKLHNLDDDLLPELREKLAGVDIRNVMLIKLESTRKDAFPIKNSGIFAQKFNNSWPDKQMPEHERDGFSKLTQTANFLTGDYDDGFHHEGDRPARGGLNCNNAFTTATYTRKSMTGTLCGVTPLVQDFNVEYKNHIYQPCLPQILDAFGHIDKAYKSEGDTNATKEYAHYPWRPYMMQATTDSYDHEHEQMPFLGFPEGSVIYKEYMKSEQAKFPWKNLPDINYYGTAEVAIEDYVRDAFKQGKEKDERVFLTHLTSTTHHPFKIPDEDETYKFTHDKHLNWPNGYVNSVGYVDRWLGKVLTILEEEKVADETLLIFVGDHGISVAENDAVTPYYNPNIGNFHVPLVFSHPKLPPININAPVQSLQILPTILDLLRETKSLTPDASIAAKELADNYEGQSILRPLKKEHTDHKQGDWMFSVMNPGRAMLSVRNANRPDWRLVVPVVENIEWRFTNVKEDPHEAHPTVTFGFFDFIRLVQQKHGLDEAEYCEAGAFMARWWVEENRKRYRAPAA